MNNSQNRSINEYRSLLKAVAEYIEVKKHYDECSQDLEELSTEKELWKIQLKQQEMKLQSFISGNELQDSKIVGGKFEVRNASDIEILPVPKELKDKLKDLVMGNEEE